MSDMTSPDPGRPGTAAGHAIHNGEQFQEQPEAAPPGAGLQDSGAADADAVAELKDRVAELENLWRRALADADNMRKRHAREIGRAQEEARAQVARELLPVLDNLDRTIDAGESPDVVAGVRQVRAQLEGVLRGYGVERIDAVNQRFDPSLHDAIGLLPVRDRRYHDVVIDQLEPCYVFGEQLLRPAKVVVGRCA